jgi:hypothetical protein
MNFEYFRYIQETNFIITGSTGGNVPPPTKNANAGTCDGDVGVLRVAATGSVAADIAQMKDSLRNKVGTFADLKNYQHEIVKHHLSSKTTQDLETYTKTLKGKNREAYNTLGLFLMEHYREEGDESKALMYRNIMLSDNPGDDEVYYRVKYFDVTARMYGKGYMPMRGLSMEDSTDLALIVASGTSLGESACMMLKLYYLNTDCESIIAENTGSSTDEPDMTIVPSFIAYLGDPVPNPAFTETKISYVIPSNTHKANITVYDIVQGKIIEEFVLGTQAGYGTIDIDLSSYSNGMYVYSLIVDGNPVDNKKMIVIK